MPKFRFYIYHDNLNVHIASIIAVSSFVLPFTFTCVDELTEGLLRLCE